MCWEGVRGLEEAVDQLLLTHSAAEGDAAIEEMRVLCRVRGKLSLLASRLTRCVAGEDWERAGSESAVDGLRHQCRLGFGEAQDLIRVGAQSESIPSSIEALEQGRIGFGHLAVLAQVASSMGLESRFVEGPYLRLAERESVNAFRHSARELRFKQDPEGCRHEINTQANFRFLNFHTCQDGSLSLRGHFPETAGQVIRTALEPLSRKSGKEDGRNQEQRSADALVEACGLALGSGSMPRMGGVRPHVMVTVGLFTLLGISDEPGKDLLSGEPVHPRTLDRLTCDGSLTRIVFDSDSVVVDVGRERRVISPAQRKAVEARDGGCRWPGCHRPAALTEGHHLKAWRDGGGTDSDAIVLLCLRHHFMVHEGGWTLVKDEDGRLIALPPPPSLRLLEPEPPRWATYCDGEVWPELPRLAAGSDPPF